MLRVSTVYVTTLLIEENQRFPLDEMKPKSAKCIER